MSRDALWRLSVLTCPEAEEAVSEILAASTGAAPSSYTDFGTKATQVSVYLKDRRQLVGGKLLALAEALKTVQRSGLYAGPAPARISLRRLPAQSWKDSWKQHFRVIEIGSRLIVKPSWLRRRAKKRQAVVVLDPGLSFGTGQHPTTAFCLRHLVRFRHSGLGQSCLDIGTGSGILAIAAAKLGYAPVDALDNDLESLRVSRANARRNLVARRIHFSQEDVGQMARRPRYLYSVVCANLISELLVRHRHRISAHVAPEGILLLAGILASEFKAVQRAYETAGLQLIHSRLQREWQSGAFSRL